MLMARASASTLKSTLHTLPLQSLIALQAQPAACAKSRCLALCWEPLCVSLVLSISMHAFPGFMHEVCRIKCATLTVMWQHPAAITLP